MADWDMWDAGSFSSRNGIVSVSLRLRYGSENENENKADDVYHSRTSFASCPLNECDNVAEYAPALDYRSKYAVTIDITDSDIDTHFERLIGSSVGIEHVLAHPDDSTFDILSSRKVAECITDIKGQVLKAIEERNS